MSDSSEEEPQPMQDRLRTVTPEYFGHPNTEMDIIGWGVFLGLLIILLPLLPFIIVLWLLSKAIEALRPE